MYKSPFINSLERKGGAKSKTTIDGIVFIKDGNMTLSHNTGKYFGGTALKAPSVYYYVQKPYEDLFTVRFFKEDIIALITELKTKKDRVDLKFCKGRASIVRMPKEKYFTVCQEGNSNTRSRVFSFPTIPLIYALKYMTKEKERKPHILEFRIDESLYLNFIVGNSPNLFIIRNIGNYNENLFYKDAKYNAPDLEDLLFT
jgi:hypothetical protein